MLRNLAAGLFEHGQIETTKPKAKAVQPFVEKIITLAKRGGFNARKRIEQLINDRKIHAWVADPNVPDSAKHNDHFDLPSENDIEFNRYGEVRKAPRLVQHIMSVIGPKYADRDGGYTRIVKIGKRRLGDGTDLCVLQLVGEEEGPQLGGGDSRRRTQKQRREDFAAKVLAGTAVAEEATEDIIDETIEAEASEEVTEVTEAPESTTSEVEETPEDPETPEVSEARGTTETNSEEPTEEPEATDSSESTEED